MAKSGENSWVRANLGFTYQISNLRADLTFYVPNPNLRANAREAPQQIKKVQ
jgi:hypothetical protein